MSLTLPDFNQFESEPHEPNNETDLNPFNLQNSKDSDFQEAFKYEAVSGRNSPSFECEKRKSLDGHDQQFSE